MSDFSQGSVPGFRAQVEGEDAQIAWSGRNGQSLITTRPAVVDSTNTDSGNTPDTTLAAGNVLALGDSDGNAYLYDPDANDGTQIARGVLEQAIDLLEDGTATDRFVQMLVGGLLKASQLSGLDPRARGQLAGRFLFDDQLTQPGLLMQPRGVYRKSSDYTVTAEDNGLLFVATAAVNFTLPTKQNGLAYRFLQTADANMTITSSSDLIVRGLNSASSISFDTIGDKIGAQVLVECVYTDSGTLKWVVTYLCENATSVT